MSREIGNRYVGNYVGPLFIYGETADLKLEPDVYQPPINHPITTKCMFLFYGTGSHALVIEFYDANMEKRRRTECTSSAFEKGLPAKRPVYGYKRLEDEKEPLATYIQGMLSDMEKPMEIPKKKVLKEYEMSASAKAKAKAAAKSAAKQQSRKVNNKSFDELTTAACDDDSDWYDDWNYTTHFEKWSESYLYEQHEVFFDLGQSDLQDFDGRHP